MSPTSDFTDRRAELHCEDVSLRVLADPIGTPAGVDSSAAPLDHLRAVARAFREVPHVVCAEGDLLAVMSAGARAFAMASSDNTRPRAAEVRGDGGRPTIVRRRETLEDLVAGETRV